MEDRQRHGPAERARQREERARERHRAGTAPGEPADRPPHRTDRATPGTPPISPPTAAQSPPNPTPGIPGTPGTPGGPASGTRGRRTERPRRARSSEPRLPGGRRTAGATTTAAPRPHPLLLPAALAAGALLALDLVLGLLGSRVVVLQVLAVGSALAVGVALWQGVAATRRHGSKLASQLAETSVDADARQVAVAGLVVNLARRNQSLVDRQLALIGDMEQNESEPDALSELFQLDHLATRIRRHAESLLVLAGDESPSRSWRHPVLLTEVARAAAAEVEDYRRVDVLVGEDVEVTGRVVADLAHLLAELVENATTYSPAERRVQVRSHTEPSGEATRPAVVVAVEDNGIGMTDADRAAANRLLAEPLVLDMRGNTMGMHVVARLAHRYGVQVRLEPTPGGGLTALVTLPADLVSERDPSRPPRPSTLQRRSHFSPVAGSGPGAGTPTPFAATRHLPPAPALPAASSRPAAPAGPAPATPVLPVAGVTPLPLPMPAPAAPPPRPTPTAAPAPAAATPAPTPSPIALPAPAAPTAPAADPGSGPAQEHVRSTIDREHVRSMLSRFQASQRAGRALADAPPGSLAPASTPATATRPVSQEDS